jgi:predicted amidohydrolase YtcJ
MNHSGWADFALVNGKIITLNSRDEIAEAVAVIHGRIIKVGSTKDIEGLLGRDTHVVDVGGKTVTPGFVESHCHPSMTGTKLVFEVDVRSAQSISDIIGLLRQKAIELPPGKWLKGWGYNDRRLKEQRHPTRWDLDEATRDHPVILVRTDAHLAVANSLALKLAGIGKGTKDPDGGRCDRDPESDEPNGLLREQAQTLVTGLMPPYTIEEIKEGILRACEQLARWGVTSFHDAAVGRDAVAAYQFFQDLS